MNHGTGESKKEILKILNSLRVVFTESYLYLKCVVFLAT